LEVNYAAAMIIIDFDNIAAKIYVKLWDNSKLKQFLEVELDQKIFSGLVFRIVYFISNSLLFILSCMALICAAYKDVTINLELPLIPAVKSGF